MYKLPPNNQWAQPNTGDNTGSLWSTFNVDLTNKQGKINPTRLITVQSTSSEQANLGLPVGFKRFDDGGGLANSEYWAVAGTRVFKTGAGSNPSAFAQDATSGTPTTCASDVSDIEEFNAELYVTTDSNSVYYVGSGSWSSFTAGGADSGNPHMLCVYANRMYMTRAGSQVISWNTSRSVASSGTNTIQLSSAGLGSSNQNIITFIKPVSNGIWIGTVNSVGNGPGRIYFWDGVTADSFTSAYVLESTGAMACVIKDDTPYIMDNNGRLLVFNGGTFSEIARLPRFLKKSFNNPLATSNERWIHPNGMTLINNRINILVSIGLASNSSKNEENAASGIWEYDENIGLYHKYSPSYYDSSVGTVTDWGQPRLAFSTGSGNETGAGALAWIFNSSDTASRNGTLFAGFKYYSNATTTKYGIFYDDINKTVQATGYIVTPKIPSSEIRESWKKLYVFHKKFVTAASDKIVVKYRTQDEDSIEGNITWTTTTSFNTSVDLSDFAIGDEVEILNGTGGGMCSHITALQTTETGYMVSVDETHTGVTTGTAYARFQHWKKAGTVQDIFNVGSASIGKDGAWVQMKVFIVSTGDNEVDGLILSNTTKEKVI